MSSLQPKFVRTGHRRVVSDDARNETVCGMVSKNELIAIDKVALAVGLTRSAFICDVLELHQEAIKSNDGLRILIERISLTRKELQS